jgi:Holliday junction resolvasome RuvABC ATP-dependent DNA helicase subunit
MKFNSNETRVLFLHGPAASGKTTFALELAAQSKNPISLVDEKQISSRKLFTTKTIIEDHDVVLLDGVQVTEKGFEAMLGNPANKTYVICSTAYNEFLPTEDDRVTVLEFPMQ